MQHLSEQQIVRRNSMQQLIERGIDPYPAAEYIVTAHAADVMANYSETVAEDGTKTRHNFQEISMAGRVMAVREAGKALFMNLQDSTGRIQMYLRRNDICPDETNTAFFDIAIKKLLDIGDFVGIKGYAFRTKTGETTIHVTEFTLLAKALRPLPMPKTDAEGNKFDEFTDPELRYRRRYVDLTVNPHVKETFLRRIKLMNAMRNYFTNEGWLEVETPILQPIHGGAAARPFKTHHNTLDMPLYLRIANELYLKRLIVGGFDGVFEFGKMFRNEGMDRTHNPEFTAMELYVAYKDYFWMMNMTENLLETIVKEVTGDAKVMIGDREINFAGPYTRLTMYESIEKYTGVDISAMNEDDLRRLCRQFHIEVDNTMGRGKLVDEIFGAKVEGNLIQPTFITDYPVEMSPLTKKHRSKEGLVERFELFINCKEVANAYSELNDPIEQRQRFEDQLALAARGDDEAMVMDEDFLRALEYGMPPTSGIGIGMDRLTMMITNQTSIQEVLFFPQMKAEFQTAAPEPQ
jgi:lysyl-tRNA synthetase, class II